MVVASKKEPSACEEIKRLNHNVRLILVIVLFAGLSESLGFGSALSAYLFKITGKENINVGYLESAMGITKLLTALPVGSISDKYGRAPVGRVGSFAYTAASAMTAYCLVANAMSRGGSDDDGRGKADDDDDDDDANDSNEGLNSKMFALWAVALCLWGFGRGVVDGPVLALFADSVPTGDRARFYLYLFYVFWAGALAGPVAAVGIFSAQRDEWTYRELSVVLFAALAFKMVNAVLLCFLRDNASLGAEAEHVRLPGNDDDDDDEDGEGGEYNEYGENPQQGGGSGSGAAAANKDFDEPTLNALLLENEEGTGAVDATHAIDSALSSSAEQPPPPPPPPSSSLSESSSRSCLGRYIPHVIFTASLVAQLGAGMTVKFFPLYFMVDCGASPATVQGIYVGVPLAMLAGGALNGRLAGPAWGLGRVQTIVLFKGLGVASLFLLVWLDGAFGGARPLYLLVPPFLLQTGLTDSTYPLEESLLMDFVPQHRRGRWKSLESVAQFGWAGSAILGGYVIDRHDYATTFVITACVQAVAVVIWAALLAVVPREERRAAGFEEGDEQQHQHQHQHQHHQHHQRAKVPSSSEAEAAAAVAEDSGAFDEREEREGSIRGVSMNQYDPPQTPTRADDSDDGEDSDEYSPFDAAVM
jgi:MFS family permease